METLNSPTPKSAAARMAADDAIDDINTLIVRIYEARLLDRFTIVKVVADAIREVDNEGVDYLEGRS